MHLHNGDNASVRRARERDKRLLVDILVHLTDRHIRQLQGYALNGGYRLTSTPNGEGLSERQLATGLDAFTHLPLCKSDTVD